MKFNETKAILKLAKNTDDEKLKEFLTQHYLDDEETEVEPEVEPEVVAEKPAVEPEVEPVVEQKPAQPDIHPDVLKLFESLNEKVDKVAEATSKIKPFGAQPKPKDGKEDNNFDNIFARLQVQSGQR